MKMAGIICVLRKQCCKMQQDVKSANPTNCCVQVGQPPPVPPAMVSINTNTNSSGWTFEPLDSANWTKEDILAQLWGNYSRLVSERAEFVSTEYGPTWRIIFHTTL
jgi:hypothetical protein